MNVALTKWKQWMLENTKNSPVIVSEKVVYIAADSKKGSLCVLLPIRAKARECTEIEFSVSFFKVFFRSVFIIFLYFSPSDHWRGKKHKMHANKSTSLFGAQLTLPCPIRKGFHPWPVCMCWSTLFVHSHHHKRVVGRCPVDYQGNRKVMLKKKAWKEPFTMQKIVFPPP